MKTLKKVKRCQWVTPGNQLYEAYHDTEWGVPVHDDRKHFEFLILEGAQAGLSWLTILKRREGYRRTYAGFDPKKVARYGDKKIAELLADKGIIRNRLKIVSSINNAKLFLQIQKEFGSFDTYIWQFAPDQSKALSADLKKRGFKFVGPTVMYAHMQAAGLVNDHEPDCFCRKRTLWEVYMIRAESGTLYTGITTNLDRRFADHKQGKRGARFFRLSSPEAIVYRASFPDRSSASKRESAIKKMSRQEKLGLLLTR